MAPGDVRQFRFQRPAGATDLLLIRHGESEAARADRPFAMVDGQGDPGLHPEGQRQAEALGVRLAGEDLAAIYVSTLRRTAETAAPLAARLGLTPIVDADLREVHLGDWEGGVYRTKMAEGDPLVGELLVQQRWDVIPGAEPADMFAKRVDDALARVAAAHPDRTVAVFTHGAFIGQALAAATSSSGLAFATGDNGSISHLVVGPSLRAVRRYNDTTHLGPHFGSVAAPPT